MRKKLGLFVCLALLLGMAILVNTGAKGCTSALQQNNETGNSFVAEAPYNLTATASSSTQVVLTWQEDSLSEQGVRVQRKAGTTGVYITIVNLGRDVHSYTDTSVAPAINYYYRTRNFYTNAESEYSNEASVTTPDTGWDMPFTLNGAGTSATSASITWSDNFSSEQGFLIERKTGSSGTYAQVGSVTANVITYTDTTLTQSMTYYYRIKADYATNNGIYSQETLARTSGITSDFWAALSSTSAPISRSQHTAIWADGYGMIIYGGNLFQTGGIYSPTANSWATINPVGTPSGRHHHTAVWTGTQMIIWGGDDGIQTLNTGGVYSPATNSWTNMTITDAPVTRSQHSAIWAGDRMMIWGGQTISRTGTTTTEILLKTGGVYFPASDRWARPTEYPNFIEENSVGAPAGRRWHTAAWSGTYLLVWGGIAGGVDNSGGQYSPVTDFWITEPISTNGAPSGRYAHTSVWTGSKMIIWGGTTGEAYLNDGAIYDPVANTWSSLASTDAPSARVYHSAVWTNTRMIIWGGANTLEGSLNSGGIYYPNDNTWIPTSTPSSTTLPKRMDHTAVWDNNSKTMIIWGGTDGLGIFYNSGASYLSQ
ncbi:MAG: kelch repeat-containing protein [Candidatus Brocadiia bacterium]